MNGVRSLELSRAHHYIVCFMYAVLDSDDDSPDIVKVAAMYLAQCNFYAAHTHLFMMQQQRQRRQLLSVFGLHAYDAITDTLSHAPSLI